MNRIITRTLGASAIAAMLFGLAACGSSSDSTSKTESKLSGTLAGAGSSAQEAAVQAWQAGFQTANPKVTVNYDPVGSGGGRQQFIAGGTAFAGSDAYMKPDEITAAKATCGSDIVEVPVYVSPIAVIFNVSGVKSLNLTPDTLAQIMSGKITKWNDAAIVAENPKAKLPDLAIAPVHRSDDSGTTKNFTDYLSKAAPASWPNAAAETWPAAYTGEAAKGTSGVVASVTNGTGTIGYADASQAGSLGKVSIKVGDSFVAPEEKYAAAMLDTAKPATGATDSLLALDLDRTTTAKNTYPVVLVSYQIACQKNKDAATGALVKAWLTYVVSPEGQQAAAKNAGSAPLSSSFTKKAQAAVKTMN